MSTIKRFYGWIPSAPDHRDLKFAPALHRLAALPASFDQRPYWPDPYNQLQLGSCTGNGVAGILHYRLIKEGKQQGQDVNAPCSVPSRLFIYREERVLEGSVNEDSGAQIRDGIKAVAKVGFCFEDLWPYSDDTDDSNGKVPPFIQKPPLAAFNAAKKHKIKKYESVTPDLDHIKAAIAADNPVVLGFIVYESFESEDVAKTGIVPMPKKSEKVLGGHCVVWVGYDDSKNCLIGRNSWGKQWGDNGHFYMPFDFVTEGIASDMWVIDAVP